ncbi:FAD-binding oxidoreductase [uncultured Jatrophihabitans sp.]|uniref:FAD-binding oxidoreductase n=1 Tax=uncultured Jatrophihabitans sp. TaxID=1610747 RepID=UPI0035CC7EBA
MTEQVGELDADEHSRGRRRAPAGGWRTAVVREVAHPSPHGVRLRLEVPDRVDHWPGQHYVIRLTAEDGYTAQRSYSVASDPADPLLEFWVERLDEGEVSGFLADVVEPGDELEIRGPIGGWFVWTATEPMLGVGGGSGVVPIVAMLRHAIRVGQPDLVRLAVASRTLAELPYADEFAAAGALIVLSREDAPDGRAAARITGDELAALVPPTGPCLACGSTAFTGAVVRLLADHGVDVRRVRVESFGPSG